MTVDEAVERYAELTTKLVEIRSNMNAVDTNGRPNHSLELTEVIGERTKIAFFLADATLIATARGHLVEAAKKTRKG